MEYTEYEQELQPSISTLVMELQTIATDGLQCSKDPYDILSYKKIREISKDVQKTLFGGR